MQNQKWKPKYSTLLTPDQLGFLEYYMLPQGDEFQYIYRPGDDSFLMLSVLKNQLSHFPSHASICEVGTGSGIISVHLNKWLQQTNNIPFLHVGTDISLDACIFSEKYYGKYGVTVEQVCTSLLKGLIFRPQIIICNPPYVPTDIQQKQNEQKYLKKKIESVVNKKETKRSLDKNLIAFSYMGGPDGLDTTRKLIESISWPAILYLIVMGEEGLQKLAEDVEGGKIISKNVRAKMEVLQYYHKANQELYVISIELVNK